MTIISFSVLTSLLSFFSSFSGSQQWKQFYNNVSEIFRMNYEIISTNAIKKFKRNFYLKMMIFWIILILSTSFRHIEDNVEKLKLGILGRIGVTFCVTIIIMNVFKYIFMVSLLNCFLEQLNEFVLRNVNDPNELKSFSEKIVCARKVYLLVKRNSVITNKNQSTHFSIANF